MVQWMGIHLPAQGTWVQSLLREDSTCHGTIKTRVAQLLSRCSRAQELQLRKPVHVEPALHREATTARSLHTAVVRAALTHATRERP